jgi:hypothetical protein
MEWKMRFSKSVRVSSNAKIIRFTHWSIIDWLHNRQQIRMSAPGTNAKFRPALKLSAYRGRAEMAGATTQLTQFGPIEIEKALNLDETEGLRRAPLRP